MDLNLLRIFRRFSPGLPVLVISMHDESLYAERVLRAGGRGYIMKQEGGKKLMEAIRQVLDGKFTSAKKCRLKFWKCFPVAVPDLKVHRWKN